MNTAPKDHGRSGEAPMDTARWQRVQALFDQARALPPGERTGFLDRACRDDADLRAEAASLLSAADEASAFFDDLAEDVLSPLRQAAGAAPARTEGSAEASDRWIGRTAQHYEVQRRLGSGGMGVVYRARDVRLERAVALKVLSPALSGSARAKHRFVAEAKAASALDHPNVAVVYEIGETRDGQLFIAMPCYAGETLAAKIARGPLSLLEALDYAQQTAAGLDAAHRKEIVHRDVKPANLIVTEEGRLKILDFGLAKMAGVTLTRRGARMGTVAYMSPEQARGDALDPRTDLWSLGAVLYEMVTGAAPFQGARAQAVLRAIRHEAPPPARRLRPDLPEALDRIIRKCLAKDPAERYATAAALREDLSRCQADLASPPADRSPAARPAAPPHRPVRAAMGGAALVFAVFALWLALLPAPGAGPETAAASVQKHLAVLPLTSAGGDAAQQAFRDGLTEALTGALGQLERFQDALWVVPASEVRKHGLGSVAEARKAFGVNLAVTGSVQQDSLAVRLTLRLVDAATQQPLASTTITKPRAALSALQGEAALALAALLDVDLMPQARRFLSAGGTAAPDAYAFYLQGLGYLQRYESVENLDYALRLFERALEEDPLYALAHAGLGEAYWRRYEATRDVRWVSEAVHHSRRAAVLDGELARAHETLGLVYAGTGAYDEAARSYAHALTLDPASAAALRGLARAYLGQGRLDSAEAAYTKAISLRPDYWAGYNELGVFYFQQGRFEDAVGQFLQVVALTPDNARGYSNLGSLYSILDRPEEAVEMLERSLAAEPSYAAYANLATLHFYAGRYAASAAMYEEALALQGTDDPRVWGNFADALRASGQEKRARQTYERAARLAETQRAVNPNDAELLSRLASYYKMTDAPAKALALTARALALAPEDPEVLATAGETYEHLGQREEALKWIGEALARGYPPKQLARFARFDALRADPRYQRLLADAGGPSSER